MPPRQISTLRSMCVAKGTFFAIIERHRFMKSKIKPLIVVRRAVTSDAIAIARIIRQTWLVTYPAKKFGITKSDIRAHVKKITAVRIKQNIVASVRRERYLVAVQDKQVIGVCRVFMSDRECRIKILYVLPKYQRLGIGSHLVWSALRWSGRRNAVVNVATYNKAAISFYQHMGFTKSTDIVRHPVPPLPNGKRIPEVSMTCKK